MQFEKLFQVLVDLSDWGILPSQSAMEIMQKTVSDVILPGLRMFGLEKTLH